MYNYLKNAISQRDKICWSCLKVLLLPLHSRYNYPLWNHSICIIIWKIVHVYLGERAPEVYIVQNIPVSFCGILKFKLQCMFQIAFNVYVYLSFMKAKCMFVLRITDLPLYHVQFGLLSSKYPCHVPTLNCYLVDQRSVWTCQTKDKIWQHFVY